MIEKIVLKNFQKHAKLVVDLDPKVTVLVGPTDSGKSSVLRALRWVCLNKLAGKVEDYIRWGQDALAVAVVADGHRVSRSRSGSKNQYKLDGQVYVAFRDGVPDDVQKLLALDGDNFQRQMDPQFWLSDNAGQVARNLNAIVNLEMMDQAQARCSSLLRGARAEEEVCRKRLQTAREQVRELSWVRGADTLLSDLERLDERLDLKRSTIAQAGQTVKGVVDATRTRVLAATGLTEGLNAVAVGRAHAAQAQRVKKARDLLSEIEKLSLTPNLPDLSPILALRKKCDAFAERRRGMERLIADLQMAEGVVCRSKESLLTLKQRERKLRPQQCPKCGQPIVRKRSPFCAVTST